MSSLNCNNFGFIYAFFVQTNLSAPSTAFCLWRHQISAKRGADLKFVVKAIT